MPRSLVNLLPLTLWVGCYLALGLVVFVGACTDAKTPTGVNPNLTFAPSGAHLAVGSQVVYWGAPNSAPINFIRLRVYDEKDNSVVGKTEEFLDPNKSTFDFKIPVVLPGGSTTLKTTLELASRDAATGTEVVEYSGHAARTPLAPGEFRQLEIDLYPGPLSNLDVTGLRINRPVPVQTEGDNVTVTATVTGGTADTRIIWSSLDANIATVASTGVVKTLLPGIARIVAAVGKLADTVPVTVLQRLVGVTITPNPISMRRGDTVTAIGRGVDPRGAAIAGENVTWSISTEGNIALVSAGRIAGNRIGGGTLIATSVTMPALSASAPVVVGSPLVPVASIALTPSPQTANAVGAKNTFTAVAKSASGAVIPVVTFQWSSSATDIATVDASGVTTAVGAGTSTIRAFVEEASGTATLLVRPPGMVITAASGSGQTGTVKGTAASAVAKVADASGRIVAGVDVTFSTTDAGATVSPTSTVQTDANGLATAAWTFGTKAGAQSAVATSAGMGNSPLAFTANVLAGQATQFVQITAPSTSATNHTPFAQQPVFEIQDEFGNPVKIAGTVISAVITAGGGTLTNATATSDANGRVTFSGLSMSGTVGARTISFSSPALPTVTSSMTLNAGAASQLVLTTAARASTNGSAFGTQPVVAIRDSSGNTVTTATDVITMTVSTGATTVGTVTATAVSGVASFATVGITGTGGTTYTLTFSRTGLTSATQSIMPSDGPVATPAAPTITSITAGSTQLSVAFTAPKNTGGSALTNYEYSTDSGGTWVTPSPAATASPLVITGLTNGTTYTVKLRAVNAVGSGAASTGSTGTPVAGTASAATSTLAVGGTTLTSGQTTVVTVVVKDAGGSLVTAATGAEFALTSTLGTIGTVSCTGGTCTATYTAVTAGTDSVSAKIGGTNIVNSPAAITVTAGAAANLALTPSAAGAASGAVFTTQPRVAVRDAARNTVTTDNSSVITMTVSTGATIVGTATQTAVNGIATLTVNAGATIVGTATQTAVNGIATFSTVGLSGTAATYMLTFATGSLTSATQTIALGAGTGTQLALTTSAAGAASGAAFTTQPIVAIQDAAGNTNTSAVDVITMTVSAGGTVVGTATKTAVNGIATFSTVGFDVPPVLSPDLS